MLVQNKLDQIINECGLSRFEEVISSNIGHFIEKCSLAIRNERNLYNETDLRNLLYVMKYLHENQSKTQKTFRLNKQMCIKVLFVILLNEKQSPNWKKILEEGGKVIAESWTTGPCDFPFLSVKQQDEIMLLVDRISLRKDLHTRFLLIKQNKENLEALFYFIQDEIYGEFIEIYEKICHYPDRQEESVKQLEAIFVLIEEQNRDLNISKELPAILKSLPFRFCILKIHRLYLQLATIKENVKTNYLYSTELEGSIHKKAFFVKTDVNDYECIPTWAEFFFVSGQRLAKVADATNDRLVIGFSLPSKYYAVLFLLLGYETWKAENTFNKHGEEEKAYFKELSKCTPDEALLILRKQRWRRCWFKGIDKVAGEECIKVDVPGSKKYYSYVPIQKIFKLRKAVDPERTIAANQIGFEMTGYVTLLKYYNQKGNKILRYLNQKTPSFIVIGNIRSLQNEIKKAKIFFNSDGDVTPLSFQDIIRFKNYMGVFDLPRGVVISTKESEETGSHFSDTVIYDGSLSYVNRQGDFQSNLEIVVLDRTDPQFSNACSALMARYYDRADELNLFNGIPASIEVVAFKE